MLSTSVWSKHSLDIAFGHTDRHNLNLLFLDIFKEWLDEIKNKICALWLFFSIQKICHNFYVHIKPVKGEHEKNSYLCLAFPAKYFWIKILWTFEYWIVKKSPVNNKMTWHQAFVPSKSVTLYFEREITAQNMILPF